MSPELVSIIREFISKIATPILIWTFIYKKAESVQKDLAPDKLANITNWIKEQKKIKNVVAWPKTFLYWFDNYFGEKILSFRFFYKAILTSLLSSIFVLFLWVIFRFGEVQLLDVNRYHFIFFFVFWLILNAIPDYVSFIETRLVLGFMAKTNSSILHVLLIIVDAIVTFFITITIPFFLIGINFSKIEYLQLGLSLSIVEGYGNMGNLPLVPIFFITSFFTSIWIWLYGTAGILGKLFHRYNLMDWFNIDQRPLSYLARYISVVVIIAYYGIMFFFSINNPDYENQLKNIEQKYTMIRENDFYDLFINADGKGIENRFELQADDKIIYDAATGLQWQRGGSDYNMTYDETKKYIHELNKTGFAGFSNWRLPSLKEAMSLMEPEKMNGELYIDPMFDQTQRWIWTTDQFPGQSWAWVVDFSHGECNGLYLYYNFYVRGVRSGKLSGGH